MSGVNCLAASGAHGIMTKAAVAAKVERENMMDFLLLVSATSSIFVVRLVFSAIFAGVQWMVLRAFLRILRAMGFSQKRERLVVAITIALFALINLPLAWFVIETFFDPRSL